MKALMMILLVGLTVTLPKMASASELPQCAIELTTAAGTESKNVELALVTYAESDLAAYAYRGTAGSFTFSVSTSDDHYIASVTAPNGGRSISESDSGLNMSVDSLGNQGKQTLSIVCP